MRLVYKAFVGCVLIAGLAMSEASGKRVLGFLKDLNTLELFDATMTCSPYSWVANKRQRGRRAARQGRISTRVRAEIQAIPAEISQISTSSFPGQEPPEFSEAGLEVGALVRLSDSVGWRFGVLRERGNVCT